MHELASACVICARAGLRAGRGRCSPGEVFPSGFLPLPAGNIRKQRLADVYRKSPLFRALRDTSRLGGKCGLCEFKEIYGGSRARAYALTGDVLAEEPCCVYQPKQQVNDRHRCAQRTTH